MPLTNEVFLWGIGILITILLALLSSLWKIYFDIKPLCYIGKQVQADALDNWLKQRGLEPTKTTKPKMKKEGHHSLSPEKTSERIALTAKGKSIGLIPDEANRLKALLEEDARNDFTNGLISFLAFLALIALIAAIVRGFTRD